MDSQVDADAEDQAGGRGAAGGAHHAHALVVHQLVAGVARAPMANLPDVDPFEMVRMVATARIAMPASVVRFAAGRTGLSQETQALCFLAGANSIFTGEKLLTTPNPGEDHDKALLEKVGLTPMEAGTHS